MNRPVPEIFDRAWQKQHYQRIAPNLTKADFLLRHMAENINERLLDINRQFANALIICPLPTITHAMPALQKKAAQIATAAPSAILQPDIVLDEEQLDLAPHAYDLIISIGSLHLLNDLLGALIQFHRALRSDGLFLASFFGGETLCELRQAFAEAEMACEGGISPRVHPFSALQTLGDLLQRAGFALPVADSDTLIVRYGEPLALLQDLRHMGQSNSLRERRKFLPRAVLAKCLTIYQEKFTDADGKLTARFDIHTLAGWAPHKSQQQPLRPGSAKVRLADALGTKEEKL